MGFRIILDEETFEYLFQFIAYNNYQCYSPSFWEDDGDCKQINVMKQVRRQYLNISFEIGDMFFCKSQPTRGT